MQDLSPDVIEGRILDLLRQRGSDKTVCPSEVARALAEDWRPLMPQIRDVARRLQHQGRIRITQRGEVVDPAVVAGPIRLGLLEGL